MSEIECIGRLDADSSGLMLWTTDMALADRIKHPSSGVEKEYLVRVTGHEAWSDTAKRRVVDAMREGMRLDDGIELLPVQARWLNNAQLQLILTEGKHRQIRRACDRLGLTVTGLKRVRIGCVRLGGLPIGYWSPLSPALQRQLRNEGNWQPRRCQVQSVPPVPRLLFDDQCL